MFKKSFISLFFLGNTLYLLQLSGNKKKILKKYSVAIPDGIIVKHRIVNTELMSKLLSTLWKKLKITDRFVALAIPEYAALTKFISLPKLPINELDEAVRLQSQEFLPSEDSEMVLDWKILSPRGKDTQEVFVVAVEKQILEGYVEAIESAGLFPLFMEIPSLSLARFTSNEDGNVLVYGIADQTIIVLTNNGKIIASSILPSRDIFEVSKTIQRMFHHFSSVTPDSIVILGEWGNEISILDEKLSKIGKLNNDFQNNIEGFAQSEIGDFIIPLSMQLTEPSEPSDPYSINLLPSPLVEKYRTKRIRLQVWGLLLVATFFIWICLFSALGTYLFITQSEKDLANSLSQSTSAKERELAVADAKEVNTVTAKVLAIQKNTLSGARIFELIQAAQPQGVSITEYKMELDSGSITVGGVAATRLALIEFRQKIEGIADASNVQIPVSSFEVDTNLKYTISFSYGKKGDTKK